MNRTKPNQTTSQYLRHGSQPESVPAIKGVPQLQPYWAAGFSFSRGHFPIQVPYDPYLPMIFQGEEISIGVRGFTHGYDFYAPEKSVNFHVYAQGENKVKRKVSEHGMEDENECTNTNNNIHRLSMADCHGRLSWPIVMSRM